MKAILEFELPEEEANFKDAIRATDMKIALDDINEIFRKRIKGNYSEEIETILDDMQQEYFNIIESIDLWPM